MNGRSKSVQSTFLEDVPIPIVKECQTRVSKSTPLVVVGALWFARYAELAGWAFVILEVIDIQDEENSHN